MMLKGFTVEPLKSPGIFARLLGRPPKENAYREIQNLLASADGEIKDGAVGAILHRYGIDRASARPRLRELYRQAIRHAAADLEITDQEEQQLRGLRDILGLLNADVNEIEREITAEIYRTDLQHAIEDRIVDETERSRMASLARRLRLPDEIAKSIGESAGGELIQRLFNQATEDRRLSPEEEGQIQALAKDLGITITHDAESSLTLDRYRLLWRIDQGDLPDRQVPVHLKRGERCHALVDATHAEIRKVTTRINYSGPTARIRIAKGLSWRMGSIAVSRVTQDVLTDLDRGTLYITSKRLLFDGSKKNTTITLSSITNFTVYTDALQVERERGKDQFFKWDGADPELIGAILGSAIALDRR